jgi:hypothetical protein
VTDVPEAARSRWPWFGVLLALMIADMMLAPLVPARAGGIRVGAVGMMLILTAALAAVGAVRVSLLVFGIAMTAVALETFSTATALAAVSLGLRTVFLCYVEVRLIWRVLTDRRVTHDTLSAVACGYVLIGLVWGGLYGLLEAVRPGSFSIPAAWTGVEGGGMAALTYFSFVTLSTLGQGDVLPAGPPAGGLCVSEAVVGQLYMGIMIARMVGILAASRSS